MYLAHDEPVGLRAAFASQSRVLLAVMLRNIRTRFFGHGLGFLIAIAWPIVHTAIVVGLFALGSRTTPVGDSAVLFIATGAIQFMTFSYLSRFMLISVIVNRPLLSFPQVKVLDVLIASAILEILSSCLVLLLFIAIAWTMDVPFQPRDIIEASYAFGAAILLGVGFGLLNGVIALANHMWAVVYSLTVILLWMTSGIYFVADVIPDPYRTILSYHPVLQCTEWMRHAYYEGYGNIVLDRAYVLEFGAIMLCLGLAIERLSRGYLLSIR